MKTHHSIIFLLTLLTIMASCNIKNREQMFKYPETLKVDTVDYYFGKAVADPYRWLEDDRSVETEQWVKRQNKFTQDYLSKIPFRDSLKSQLKNLWNYEKMTTPYQESGLLIYSKNDGLQNQNVYYYKDDKGIEKLLLDPNQLSEDGTVALSSLEVSKDGKYLAYSISKAGSDWREIFVKEIESGKLLPDHITWVKFSSIAWYKNGFYYARYEEPKQGDELKGENLNSKVFYHQLGENIENDQLVYEDTSHPEWSFYPYVTEDNNYLVIDVTQSTSGNALYIKDISKSESDVIKLIPDFDNDNVLIRHQKGVFYLKTNYKAPKQRIVKFSLANAQKSKWKDLIPEQNEVLTGVSVVGGKMIAQYMKDAHDIVKVFSMSGTYLHELELPDFGSVYGFSGDEKDEFTYFTFTSFVYPSTIYKYNTKTNTIEKYWQPNIGIQPADYVTKQIFYTSKDSTKVPMYIIHKKGLSLDGTNPTLLYGYGGFNISLTPSFSVSRMLILENGGVYAIPNIRGGGEYGEEWHKAGTKLQKQNVFDDFIGAAEYLITQKYTSPNYLAVSGGSNGGLLVGAVVNQRPELFKVAFPAVGVMDMLRYHKFTIGRYWAADYGTSEDNEEMFNYLYAYSPIHNVIDNTNYPAIMVQTADHDDRVVPAHSFKYAAQLQNHCYGANPVIIRIETNAGHGAGVPTDKKIEELADVYSFMLYNMNVKL